MYASFLLSFPASSFETNFCMSLLFLLLLKGQDIVIVIPATT
jgi:hypothetical protein